RTPTTSLKTSIKTITNLSDTNCLEIHGASLSARFYQEVLDDASVSDIQKAQFEYLFVSKVDAMTIGDLYRLYDFNRGGR
ncbi:hypothetical protein VC154_22510, partial [Citrobacter freundii]|nr:hypothetical protein [Citrobacter freundii]